MGKRAKPDEIIAKQRGLEVRLSRGEMTGQTVQAIRVTEQTYYRRLHCHGPANRIKSKGRTY